MHTIHAKVEELIKKYQRHLDALKVDIDNFSYDKNIVKKLEADKDWVESIISGLKNIVE